MRERDREIERERGEKGFDRQTEREMENHESDSRVIIHDNCD